MAEGASGERTQAPTPRKRQQAREKGQVPKSQEVASAVLLLAGAGLLHAGGGGLVSGLRDLFVTSVLRGTATLEGVEGYTGMLRDTGWWVVGALLPLLAGLAGAALAVGVVQGRGVLTLEPLTPKLEKLDPVKNGGRIWGAQAPAQLLKSLFKLGIVALAVWFALGRSMEELPALSQQSPMALLLVLRAQAVRVLAYAGGAMLVLAAADYAWQVWQHEKQLKMSHQEIKEENKTSEGDPNVKARRRSMARSMARRRMMLAVSDADVVVTNPTHVAVALKYDPELAEAPVILAMGERKVAERIKALAAEAGVPRVENVPVARALLAGGEVGRPIPIELYVAVAEIMAFVIKHRRSRGGAGR